MISLLLLPKLLIAGGSSFLGNVDMPTLTQTMNHTLKGEQIPSAQVVCRDHWGTPMLPDGKGSYSLIAPINKKLIAQSLWIPPVSGKRPAVVASKSVAPASPSAVPSLPLPEALPTSPSSGTPPLETTAPAKPASAGFAVPQT
jgi:hypothetical protein